MSQTNSQDNDGFWKDERGLGLADSPWMIFLAVIILAFVTVLGLYIAQNFMSLQSHATAVDAAEKIYNTADLLSSATDGSSRTLWVKIPEGYGIEFPEGDILLKDSKGVVGTPLHINGVKIGGSNIGPKQHHLKLELKTGATQNRITVTEIDETPQ